MPVKDNKEPQYVITTRGHGGSVYYGNIENFWPDISSKNHEIKVIFNPPATILYMNGNKYVSKVHGEEFDEEKGLLMCLAKAHGHSHGEIKQMLKNAKRHTNKKGE
jgi:hypothetical protein